MTEGIEVGQVLAGKYRVERLLGAGGMGFVLLASHLELHQRVALKLLHRELGDLPAALARFMQEGRTAARLRSEHVGKVLDVGRLPTGEAYLVMEYLEGHDLANEIAERGAVAIPTAVDYVLQACEAVAEAHALGIIHRDLKPANLFLAKTAYGEHCVKVLDFGISKIRADANLAVSSPALTGSHTIMGSPSYMAPEQMRASRDVNGRTDIWALGTILYELIAGHAAFAGDTLAVVCSAVLNDAPASLQALRPDVPPGLESIVFRCLSKDAAHRYGNVVELVHDLLRFAPEQSRDVMDRINRLVGDLASNQLRARAASPADPSSHSSDAPGIPPTLSMLHEPAAADVVKFSETSNKIKLPTIATAPGTGVVWSGTNLGISTKPKRKRSVVFAVTALLALAAGAFMVLRLRASVTTPTAAAASAGPNNGALALAAPPPSNAAASPPASQGSLNERQSAAAAASASAAGAAPEKTKNKIAESSKALSRPPPAAHAEESARASEPVVPKPEPPKVEPAAAPVRSSRVTDYGGRE